MAAPIGNEFWRQVVEPTGRPKKYNPDTLWQKAMDYFEWVEQNPLYECKPFAFQGDVTKESIPKMRAMTEMAFCLFAGITDETFRNYKSGNEEYKEFFGVAKMIEQVIYNQKFEGAAADLLNSNIIARDLGLTDKQDMKLTGALIWNETKTYDPDQKANSGT